MMWASALVHERLGQRQRARARIEVRVAQSALELEQVYRLRYEICVHEMGLKQVHADYVRRRLREPCDERAQILVALDGLRVVGTLRQQFGANGLPEEYVELLHMERLAGFPTRVSLTTKLAVHPDYRGSPVLKQLCRSGFAAYRTAGIHFDCICCYPNTRRLFVHLGYRQIFPDVLHPEYGTVHPMVLDLRDLDHMRRVRSPLLADTSRVCRRTDGLSVRLTG